MRVKKSIFICPNCGRILNHTLVGGLDVWKCECGFSMTFARDVKNHHIVEDIRQRFRVDEIVVCSDKFYNELGKCNKYEDDVEFIKCIKDLRPKYCTKLVRILIYG